MWEDDNPTRLIFLGSLALGDEEAPLAYGDNPKRDMAGIFERTGPFRWRLVIPWPQDGSKLHVFELTPVADQPQVNEPTGWPTRTEVRAHLIAAAAAGHALSYSELLGQLGYAFSRPKMRALCAVLGAVDEEAEARGEPELAVLVVRQSDGLAGAGLVGRRRGREAWLCRRRGKARRRGG